MCDYIVKTINDMEAKTFFTYRVGGPGLIIDQRVPFSKLMRTIENVTVFTNFREIV
jgi:hypothetical protein